MNTITHHPQVRAQAGAILLEALVAILIFSVGILAVVGMQATAVKAAAEAKYRSEASLLATDLIGQMWVSDRTGATMKTNFQGGEGTDGAAYTVWLNSVIGTLAGVTTTVNVPKVTIDSATGMVTVKMFWALPSEVAGTPAHNYAVVAQIK